MQKQLQVRYAKDAQDQREVTYPIRKPVLMVQGWENIREHLLEMSALHFKG